MKSFVLIFLLITQFSFTQTSKKDFKTTKLENEGEIGKLLIKAGKLQDLDSIVFTTSKALVLSLKNKDEGLQAHAYYRLGTTYTYMQDLNKASFNIEKCLKLAKKNNFQNFLRESYRMLGVIAGERNDYNSCLNNFKESLKYATNPQDINSIKLNIAVIYINNNKSELAYDLLIDIVKYYESYKGNDLNKDFLTIAYINLSVVAPTTKERLNAINKAILTSKDTQDYDLQTSLYLKKGELLLSLKNYKQASIFLKKAYKESKKGGYNITAISSLISLSKCYYKTKEYNKAADYMDTLLNPKLDVLKIPTTSKTIDSLAHIVYFKTGSFNKSFFHAERYISHQDSLIKSEKNNAYIEYGKKYQTEKKIQENKLLKKDILIKDLEVKKQKKLRYIFSLITLIFLFLFFFFYYRNKVKAKNNLLLLEKNKVISEQNNLLENANTTKQKLFTLISHDLINPFNTLLGYTQLLKEDYNNLNEEQKISYIEIIYKSAKSNHSLVKNLLNWSRVQQNAITVNKKTYNSFNLIKDAITPYELLAQKKNIGINYPQNKNLACFADENLLKTCLGNLFSNAIKYTPRNGTINFTTDMDAENFYITVQDNGVGMSLEQQNNLFDLSKSKSIPGTEKEKGTGLGLIICKEFIELQNGSIEVNSEVNNGTLFKITLPNITN